MKEVTFTLFVPCYNSELFINRVFNSLINFDYRDFELVIINDASTDNTHKLITEFIKKLDEPVKYICWDENRGLYENINYALSIAKGKYFFGMGHDDEYYADTLSTFVQLFNEYNKDKIAGIGALCENQHGELIDYEYPLPVQVADFYMICYEKDRFRKEVPFCFRTDLLQKYYVKNVNPAQLIGCYYKYIFINKIIRKYYVNENPYALTARSRYQSSYESYVNYTYWVNHYQYRMQHVPYFRYRGILAYPFQGILAKVSFREMLKPIIRRSNKVLVALFYIPALILTKIIR